MIRARILLPLLSLLLATISLPAHAVDVVATLPWIGDIATRLAPDADVTVLARGTEDPHYLSPTPALMSKVSKADLYAEVGLSLELWSERLLDGAGNPAIRPGGAGYVRVSEGVPRLEVPTELTRAKGDLHPDGNPHIWTDPLNAIIAADNLAAGLGRVDPANAAAYTERAKAFRQEVYERLFGADLVGFMGGTSLEKLARSGRLMEFLDAKGLRSRLGGWLGRARPGKKIVFYHQSWPYFIDRFGVELVGTIEDRPGVSPSAAHKQELAQAMKARGCKLIGITSYYNDRIARALAADTGATVVVVPGDVGGVPEATDYFTFIDVLVDRLLQ
ncbi:MAG: zinc ABC transporter substrate-binding protein [Deltaproteobacteria bacterium]|nr:MAG: zinc ABC transporter substrate-binding protein [Deltaproteobacteria bacterium]